MLDIFTALGGLFKGGSLTAATAISAGTELIGGVMNRNATKAANKKNSPAGQVAQWEEAGINPLFGLSSGAYIPQQAVSMGDSFASAGGKVSRGLELIHQEKLQETALKQENQKLKEQLDVLAYPREPSNMTKYGGLVPLPGQGGGNAQQRNDGASDPLGGGSAGLVVSKDNPSVVAGPDRDGWIRSAPGAAEQGEEDYGEIGGEVIGLDTFYSDFRGNYFGHAFDPQWGWEYRWPRPKARPKRAPFHVQSPMQSGAFGDGWMNQKFQ